MTRDDDRAAPGVPHDVDRRPPPPLLATSQPGRPRRHLGASAGSVQVLEPTDGGTDPAGTLDVRTGPGWGLAGSGADTIDRSDPYTSGVLEVPISWLDLTPPSGSLHLKLREAQDAYRAEIWSQRLSPDEQDAWARSQGGWSIRDDHRSQPHVVSFTVGPLPAGLAWLAQLPTYQHLELHADGSVRLHLRGVREDIQEVYRRLSRATDVGLVRVADTAEEDLPAPGPRVTTAQRAAIETAYAAGYFSVPRETRLAELAEDLGQSQSSLSELLRRGIAALVEHLLGEDDRSASPGRPAPIELRPEPHR